MMMAIYQPGNNDKTTRIKLPVRFLRWFVSRRNDFQNIAAVDHDTVRGISFRARPDRQGILDPGSEIIHFVVSRLETVYSRFETFTG